MKITEFNQIEQASDGDYLLIWNSALNATQKVSLTQLKTYLGAAPVAQPESVLFFDDFEEADNTNLNGRSKNNKTWFLIGTNPNQIWQIKSGQATTASSSSSEAQNTIAVDCGSSAVKITCALTWYCPPSANQQQGFVLRYKDINNYWYVRQVHINGQLQLIERVNGTESNKFTISRGVTNATTVQIKIEVSNAAIKYYENDSLLIDVASSTLATSTSFGLWSYQQVNQTSTSGDWDNFKIVSLT